MKIIGVIPARFGSTRFPGKPLQILKGKPLLQWTIEGTKKSKLLNDILVATDDARIESLCKSLGVNVAMTDSNCATGTDRIYQAVQGQNFDVVINVQGDEPMINESYIDPLATSFKDNPALDMATLAHPLTAEDVSNPNAVKVVVNQYSDALYFSRFGIPYSKGSFAETPGAALKHIGLYGYSMKFLQKFCTSKPASIEQNESLEQLRALYLGARIRVIKVDQPTYGVDTPEDLRKLEAMLK